MCSFFHRFEKVVDNQLPKRFNCPYSYFPHPLCVKASEQVMRYLQSQTSWHEELKDGKMFGVMLVKNRMGEIGFLAAFSGLLQQQNKLPYFVPPIYDLQNPNDHFKQEERLISDINNEISKLENSAELLELKQLLSDVILETEKAISEKKKQMEFEKSVRDEQRKMLHFSTEDDERLKHESALAKIEFKRLKNIYSQKQLDIQQRIENKLNTIENLKQERKIRSSNLQKFLFENYVVQNAFGERKNVYEIFSSLGKIPPAGTGECAAPKLLHFAYENGFVPLAVAEFWYGNSPKKEVRHHGNFYGACHAKCEPILNFMLQGLDVEENPLEKQYAFSPEIIYEDEWILLVNKPSGMLSAKGKNENVFSVEEWAKQKYADAQIVHRLDMQTSGLLLIAKEQESYKNLQKQFLNRTVHKQYVALLDGVMTQKKGVVKLPLCLDVNDRPRQMVDMKFGKYAETEFELVSCNENISRVVFSPLTGRTHQIRVHAAHPEGLNMPIVGDELYGKKAERLFLHAEKISFSHPKTNERMIFVCPPDF